MDMIDQVRAALTDELKRQAAAERLSFDEEGGEVELRGRVDMDALAEAVIGAVAGGP